MDADSSPEQLIRFEDGIARLEYDGAPTPAQFRQAIDELFGAPEFREGCPLLWDMRRTRFDLIETSDMRYVAERAASMDEAWGRHRVAVVVDRDLEFGLGRVYEALAQRETLELEIFRDPELALAWLREPPGS